MFLSDTHGYTYAPVAWLRRDGLGPSRALEWQRPG